MGDIFRETSKRDISSLNVLDERIEIFRCDLSLSLHVAEQS